MNHDIAYEGVHVSLGQMQEAYVEKFVPWMNRRIGIEGTLQRPPYSLAMGLEWVRGLDKRKGTDEVFAVLVHEGTSRKRRYRYIGHMGIHGITWPHGFATTGSILGDGRGKGYGTEAKLLILEHAFRVLGLRKVLSKVKAFNAQSTGHLLKCGYRIVGCHKAQDFHEGQYVDELLLEAFREDWEPIHSSYRTSGKLPKLTSDQKKLIQSYTR